jgi:excisionase family DNA binding protein
VRTLDINECAAFLRIDRTTALALANRGEIPGAKVGRAWVFLEEDLAQWLRGEIEAQQRLRRVEAHGGEIGLRTTLAPSQNFVESRRKRRPLPDLGGLDPNDPPRPPRTPPVPSSTHAESASM